MLMVLVVVALTAAGLLWFGWRGRRVDEDHPYCARCGFNLSGLPDDTSRCSECGVNVRRPGTVRVGRRVKREGLLYAGVALATPLLLTLGLLGWSWANNSGVDRYKPVWWLAWSAQGSDPAGRDSALRELSRRIKDGGCSAAQVSSLVKTALTLQGDRTKPWVVGWGDLIETSQLATKLTSAQWDQYVQQIALPTMEVRSRVRRGDPLPIWLGVSDQRAGSRSGVQFAIAGFCIDGVDAVDTSTHVLHASGSGPGGRHNGTSLRVSEPVFAKMIDGPHVLNAIATGTSGGAKTWKVRIEQPWTLTSEPTVKLIKDEGQRPAIEKSVRIVSASSSTGTPLRVSRWGIDGGVHTEDSPYGLAWEVWLRDGQREHRMGKVNFKAGRGAHRYQFSGKPEGFSADRADIILRPSAEVAAGTVDLFEIWDGEIVVRDAPLEWPSGTTRPAQWKND